MYINSTSPCKFLGGKWYSCNTKYFFFQNDKPPEPESEAHKETPRVVEIKPIEEDPEPVPFQLVDVDETSSGSTSKPTTDVDTASLSQQQHNVLSPVQSTREKEPSPDLQVQNDSLNINNY